MIREKRSKKRNDRAQSTNIAPDHFDSAEAQNEFSQTVPTVNLHSEQLLQTQGSSTPSVNTVSNTRKNTPESPVVSIHSMILNQIKVRRYQEQIYIVPLDIVNFMLGTHGMECTDKRTNKAYRFDIEQYAHHRQFLHKRKLASHPLIADVNKKKFYVLDPVNKLPEHIPDSKKQLNKFVGLIIFPDEGVRWAEPLMEDGLREEAASVDSVTRTLKLKEIDDFRYQYSPNLLLHEMNKIRDQVIWESEVIRLSKPSDVLSSPYCKFTYGDLDRE
ncbi:hypothetical protein Ahy_B07g086726 [Arachis hypogaea]|uniref:Uncharacterized protein n=1 Tax=Arachis hypogaea TaxID=3818 RepID=A0A444YAC1_ARAHY|nr:hypothetical protein Ahy_B07g086726 [Arachis hypogaea]